MKTIKHIWKYLTSPMSRHFVDLQTCQQAVDAHMEMMREQLRLSNFPPIVIDYAREEGISTDYARAILKAKGAITSVMK